jgi:hypothetical protein
MKHLLISVPSMATADPATKGPVTLNDKQMDMIAGGYDYFYYNDPDDTDRLWAGDDLPLAEVNNGNNGNHGGRNGSQSAE